MDGNASDGLVLLEICTEIYLLSPVATDGRDEDRVLIGSLRCLGLLCLARTIIITLGFGFTALT